MGSQLSSAASYIYSIRTIQLQFSKYHYIIVAGASGSIVAVSHSWSMLG